MNRSRLPWTVSVRAPSWTASSCQRGIMSKLTAHKKIILQILNMWENQTSKYSIQSAVSHKAIQNTITGRPVLSLSVNDLARHIQGIWNILSRNDRKISLNNKNIVLLVCHQLTTAGLRSVHTKLSSHLQQEKEIKENKCTCFQTHIHKKKTHENVRIFHSVFQNGFNSLLNLMTKKGNKENQNYFYLILNWIKDVYFVKI